MVSEVTWKGVRRHPKMLLSVDFDQIREKRC